MTLRTGAKTTFDKIKVGEVFAWEIGIYRSMYFVISEKISKKLKSKRLGRSLILSHDFVLDHDFCGMEQELLPHEPVYRLPLSVQRLWRTD